MAGSLLDVWHGEALMNNRDHSLSASTGHSYPLNGIELEV
jgi:hypothetical protein